ncbi:MAG: ABC transporter ATP-binding protein [Sphaerochaetaceae bacterium]
MEHEDIGQAVVRLDAVKKYYMVGEFVVKAVDGVSLAIAQGEFTAIMGPSGSGKSTMMNLIGCLDVPTGGTIYIDGEATSGMDEEELAYLRNRKVGFVFQQFNLLGKLTALENVMTPLLYRGMPSGERKERAASALERVGLRDRMLHRPNELSGGQKQRVAIARALVTGPSLLLADEPTGALDSSTGLQIMEEFENLNNDGLTVVLVTHDQSLGMRCRRQIRVRDGHLEGGGEDVL